MGNHLMDLTDMQFGKLHVIRRADNDKNGNPRWLCECKGCGREVVVYGKTLRNGKSRSCGAPSCRKNRSDVAPDVDLTWKPSVKKDKLDDELDENLTWRPGEETLCFSCKNAVGWCVWSARFEAVPGWDAIKTQIKGNQDNVIQSYLVRHCPLYEPDDPPKKKRRKRSKPKES